MIGSSLEKVQRFKEKNMEATQKPHESKKDVYCCFMQFGHPEPENQSTVEALDLQMSNMIGMHSCI